ncbi:hypothetical protein EGT49_09885 [Companilactobacillus suantsaicola]|uniref:Uncharacterized protein n=1 Tax=Companilactobacillus suantsaicola TaxID=2487723 RepID=A0A4Z0JGW9_9LACO|nr:hypothetical protein [Companilactobacillus suantsaicola]TGD22020.1 hypothetical protein EGT49_09885 [Companilactobacillus suantsaicola]
MSNLMGLSKNLFMEKFKLMNLTLGIDVLAVIVSAIMYWVSGGFHFEMKYLLDLFLISMSIMNLVSFILLANKNEHIFTSNNYRLLPITDTKLYFSNLLTTFLAFVYLQVVSQIISGILYWISGADIGDVRLDEIPHLVGFVASLALLLIIITLMLYSAITVIHFLTNWIKGVLPFKSQKWFNFILYLVVIWIALAIFNGLTVNIFRGLNYYDLFNASSMERLNQVLLISSGIFFVWIVIFSLFNIYLLKRWVETIR